MKERKILKASLFPLGLWLVWSLISCFAGIALAESEAEENVSLGHFPGALLDDIVALPSTENAWWLLGGTALTIGVYQFEDAEDAAKALDQDPWDSMSDFGNIWGDVRVQGTLALGAWGIGSWAGSNEVAGLGFDLSRGLLLTYATTSILKVAVNRTRPNGEDYSFPSGHTASAFTTAGVVTRRYGGWAGGVSIALGVMTAMGRMEDMKHYASDVVAGATIGWIIGRTVARHDPEDKTAWQVVPFGSGLAMIKRF
jgi:membrane-associated phospholipid phosphatase